MGFDIFGPTYSLLSKVLDLRSQRHTLVSSNIANADTPDYKAVHINFEDELEKMMPTEDKLRLKTTNENHIPRYTDIKNIRPSVVQETTQTQRADGNTVDMDKEIVKMSKNQLMYNAISQILGKKFRGLYNAIREVK
jgi:flagellar basal-body rod protein FlgB